MCIVIHDVTNQLCTLWFMTSPAPSSPVHNRRLLTTRNIRMSSVELPDDNEKSLSSASTSPCPSPVSKVSYVFCYQLIKFSAKVCRTSQRCIFPQVNKDFKKFFSLWNYIIWIFKKWNLSIKIIFHLENLNFIWFNILF